MSEDQSGSPPPEEPNVERLSELNTNEEKTLGPKAFEGSSKEFYTTIEGGVKVSGTGDHSTYNYYEGTVYQGADNTQIKQQLKDVLKEVLRESEAESADSPDQSSDRKKVPGRRYRFAEKIEEDISISEAGDDNSTNTTHLPETDAELAHWYSELGAYDKCFVQAMLVFDGASLPEIAYATNQLYEPVKKAMASANSQQSATSARIESPDDVLLRDRLARTFTKIRRVSRGSRLFWQDADARGISQFKLRLHHFIAEEVHMWTGSVFLERLRIWAENLADENGPRAVRTLGAIWWHQADRLQRIANQWAEDEKWYRAAYLLDGAYEVDRITFKDAADDAHKSPVLWLVQKWVREARFSEAVNRGCAAALTYALIGERSPALALRGLDSLLELPPPDPKSNKEPAGIDEEIYEAVVLSYVDLAIYGHLREVLQHLARRLELTSYRRLPLTEMKSYQRIHYRIQRQVQLIAALDAFSRIANHSFQNLKDPQWVKYTLDESLPPSTALTNSDGREILLFGLLKGEWKTQVSTLLCAAFIEKLGDFAFVLLRLWADIVLKDQGPSPDKIRKAYVEFVTQLGQMIRTWCNHVSDLGFTASSAPDTFRHKLEKWQKEGQQRNQPIGAFAQEILEQLPL